MEHTLWTITTLASQTAPASGADVPGWQTGLFAAILVLTLAALASEKLPKSIIALISALVCLLLGDLFGYFEHPEGLRHLPTYIPLIEWEVIGIVVGATIFVEIAATSGVFTYISVRILKASRGDPFRLLILLSILTCIFSAFLDNITAMIIIGSLTIVACRKLALDPKPFLITEAIMTNVGGMLTLISSIPNIIIGKTAGISYATFLIVTTPYVIVTIIASVFLCRWLFGKAVAPLTDPATIERHQMLVDAFDEWETVNDRRFFYISMVATLLVILGFAFKSQIPVLQDFGIEIVAILFAVFMLVLDARNVDYHLRRVDWALVFFFIGLFIIVGVLEKAAVLMTIGQFLDGVLARAGPYGLMWLTAMFSSVTDNIPLAAMLAKIYEPAAGAADQPTGLWWAIVFGANLGGNITPIGSASTVVAVTIMKKNNMKIRFLDFVRIGGTFAIVQLVLATAYLAILISLLT